MNIIYGCECFGANCQNHPEGSENKVPCAFIVERNGKQIQVCTKCDLIRRGDKYIARLFDEHTIWDEFEKHDILGALVMLSLLDENKWQEKVNRSFGLAK